MTSKVALVEYKGDYAEAFAQANQLIDGLNQLNIPKRPVVIKVGVFSHKASNHVSAALLKAIIDNFSSAPNIFLAESDNYEGTALERLQIWKELFTEQIKPYDLSDTTETRKVTLAGQEFNLSNVLFKPNVLLSTHILRTFERGSILKNLFGCIPSSKKAKYHKILPSLLADLYEAVGGVDLAVIDGTMFWRGAGVLPIRTNTILVGKDAVAVEAVGAYLAGLKPEKNPVLQEFLKRGLGEGELRNIAVVGIPLEALKPRFKLALKQHTKLWRECGGAPKTWAPAIDDLIQEGFFKLPKKRTKEDVFKVLKAKSVPVEGNLNTVITTLNRRIQKGLLKSTVENKKRTYYTE